MAILSLEECFRVITNKKFHKRLIFVVTMHGMFGMAWNFQYMSVNLLEPFIAPFTNQSFIAHYGRVLDLDPFSWLWAGMAVSYFIGAIMGGACLSWFFETLGRRDTLMIFCQVLLIISSILQAISRKVNSFELIMLGRVILGFAANCGSYYVFVTECVPDEVRGEATMLVALCQYIWILLGTILALPQALGTEELWEFYFLIPIVPAIIYMCTIFYIPRSPKYLYIEEKKMSQALDSIEFYHGKDVKIEEIIEEYDRESQLAAQRRTVTFMQIWKAHQLRYPFLICILAALAQSFSGEPIGAQYSNVILQLLGVDQQASVTIMALLFVMKVVFGFVVCLILIEKIGRRPLLIGGVSSACLGIILVFIGNVTFDDVKGFGASSIVGVFGYFLIVFGDVLGVTSIPNLLIGEMNPQASRSHAATAFQTVLQFFNFVQILCFPPFLAAAGPYSFLYVLFVELVVLGLLIRYLPETKSLPVNEIVEHIWEETDHFKIDENTPLLVSETLKKSSSSTESNEVY